ncbi:hypothetical protein V2I01_14680 [Micromonospora sp. BRA006-A]|nr:hypothetical protein [Micromonospora sp. BRA006-A]
MIVLIALATGASVAQRPALGAARRRGRLLAGAGRLGARRARLLASRHRPAGRQLAAYLIGTFPVMLAGMAVGNAVGGQRRLLVAGPGNAMMSYAWLVIAPALVGLWIRPGGTP